MAASDSTPSPIKGQQFEMAFVFIDTSGKAIAGASGIVTKIMKDDGSAAVTTNTTTETALGFYRIVFTGAEMNADRVDFVATCSTTNAQDTFASIATQSAGKILVNMQGILAATLTEASAGQLTGGFKKWFDVATPVGTVNSIPNATAGAAGGLFIAGTNAATTITGALTTTFTGNLTGNIGGIFAVTIPSIIASPTNITGGIITTVTNLTNAPTSGDLTTAMKTSVGVAVAASAVASVTGNVAGNVVGSVGSVAGGVGGNVTGSVGSISGITFPAHFADLAITVTTGQVTTGAFLSTLDFTATMKTSLNAATPSVPTAAAIAAATRDVNNTSPAANSLGAAVNAATAPTVGQIDAQLSSTHGSGQWGSSTGSGAFVVTVTVSDGSNPGSGANVRLTNGVTTLVAGTNNSGVATFSVDAAVWARSITKSGYTFTPDTITVSAAANFAAVLVPVVIPAPPAGGLISNVFGNFAGLSSGIPSGVQVKFQLSVPSAKSGYILLNDPIIGRISNGQLYGPSGQAYVPLYRNDGITPSMSTYLVSCADIGLSNTPMTLNSTTYDLAQLIPP